MISDGPLLKQLFQWKNFGSQRKKVDNRPVRVAPTLCITLLEDYN